MKIDYSPLIAQLASQFAGTFSIEEIQNILKLEEDVDKDTPLSTGRRLSINRVKFSGKKVTDESHDYSDNEFLYDQTIKSGVSIWIADNLKGKSSILKIIKFALTGDNSVKSNVSKWVQRILVTFSISDKKYSIYINKEKRSPNATLFSKELDDYPHEDEHADYVVFTASTYEELTDNLEDFFFKQFSYYSLKWTQKHPQKDNDSLVESNASWKTYFKSILLESKDSNALMYGDQGKKVFQMLLGLHHTYPINRLTVAKDRLLHERGREKSYRERKKNENVETKAQLEEELKGINAELSVINLTTDETKIQESFTEYNHLLKQLEEEQYKRSQLFTSLNKVNEGRALLDEEISKKERQIQDLNRELAKVVRQQRDIEEYLEIGVFFANLDVKHCPSCNHSISKERKENAAESHTCLVCSENVSEAIGDVDTDSFRTKLSDLERAKNYINENIERFKSVLSDEKEKLKKNSAKASELEKQRSLLRETEELSAKLSALTTFLNDEKRKIQPAINEKELLGRKAVIEFRIAEIESLKIETSEIENYDNHVALLESAIQLLSNQRFQDSEKILDRLSKLMLEETKALGLSVSEIVIGNNFEIQYKQDGDFLSFDKIAEGEQLRAKLAFYLSLIQLDIEYNFGRHTRLLIIDSPGKEEGDKSYLQGLADILKGVENRFGNNLQILIATAERGLTDILEQQFVFPEKTFVF